MRFIIKNDVVEINNPHLADTVMAEYTSHYLSTDDDVTPHRDTTWWMEKTV